jgi:hypothetical protein
MRASSIRLQAGCVWLLATATASAQVVTVANPTGYAWTGHLRVEAPAPAAPAGWSLVGHRPHWAVAAQDDGWAQIDLCLDLGPGCREIVDLGACQPALRPLPWLADVGALYQGHPLVSGVGLTWAPWDAGGAGLLVRGHALVGNATVAARGVIYPSEPATVSMRLEVSVWHPAGAGYPVRLTHDVRLSWGDAQVWGPSGTDLIWTAGTVAVSGSRLTSDVVCFWPRLATPADLQRAHALRAGGLVWSSR